MKDSTSPSLPKRIVYSYYRSRYLGLYFWSIPARARQTARQIVIGDVLATIGVVITLIIAVLLRFNLIDISSLREQPNIKTISLVSILGLCAILSFIVHQYLKKNLDEDGVIRDLKVDQYSKKAALPHFLLVIFGPLLYTIFYASLLKLLTYFV